MDGMLQIRSKPIPVLPNRMVHFARRSWGLAVLVLGLFLAMLAAPARAEIVQLAYKVQSDCTSTPCAAAGSGAGRVQASQWTWFAVDPTRLANMPAGWNLVIDNTRFTAIEIRVVHKDGVSVVRRGQFALGRNWTMGNNLRFVLPIAGRDIRALQIGYRNIDSPGLMRSIKAMDREGHDIFVQRWTVQVALVLGVLFSAFVYNMFLLTWLRTGFQRWYVVWLAGSLAYLLVWTGAILNFFPFLAGPASVRTFYLLLGLIVVSGAAFFFSLIEKDKLPQRFIDFGQLAGMGVALAAVFAAFDMLFPAALGDLRPICRAVGPASDAQGLRLSGATPVWVRSHSDKSSAGAGGAAREAPRPLPVSGGWPPAGLGGGGGAARSGPAGVSTSPSRSSRRVRARWGWRR